MPASLADDTRTRPAGNAFIRVPVAAPGARGRPDGGLVTHSEAMRELAAVLDAVAASDCAVLVTGETGTGKERVARALHARSHRRHRRLLAMHCAAIPATLLERELFGNEPGAYTGATRRTRGAFEAADGGTFLLDEIGELEPSLQVKLLRVLQEKEIVRLGSPDAVPVDVRVLAATSRDLRAEVERGAFRADLFFRLNTVELHVPPLRQRREDILAIAAEALADIRADGGPALELRPAVADRLLAYHWPGNVRELLSALERASLLCKGPRIEPEHLPPEILDGAARAPIPPHPRRPTEANPLHVVAPPNETPAALPLDFALPDFREARRQFERGYLLQALAAARGNISAAARRAGLSWKHFRHKMRQLGIRPDAGSS